MSKETAPPTPVPMGNPANDIVVQEGFCATIIDTKRKFQEPGDTVKEIAKELLED